MASRQPTSFAESIRLARTARGWSQEQLAQALGVRRQSVALWEGGEMPGAINLAKLRDLLGDDLLEPTAPPSEAALAYWRGRVDSVARMMEAVLTVTRELSSDMGSGGLSGPVATEVTTLREDEGQDAPALGRPVRRRGA